MFEDFERLAVDHLGHAVGDGSHAIMQVHLPRGDIDRVVMLLAEAVASGRKRENAQQEWDSAP